MGQHHVAPLCRSWCVATVGKLLGLSWGCGTVCTSPQHEGPLLMHLIPDAAPNRLRAVAFHGKHPVSTAAPSK